MFLGADREHDSLITIKKSIAFHPSTNQLSHNDKTANQRDVMHKHTRNDERYSKLSSSTREQQQGARDNEAAATTRRRRRNEAKNSTATHSPSTTHSSLPISLSFIHSLVRSLEPMIDIDIDCIGVMHINVVMVCVNIDGPLSERERERERESIMISRDSSSSS